MGRGGEGGRMEGERSEGGRMEGLIIINGFVLEWLFADYRILNPSS